MKNTIFLILCLFGIQAIVAQQNLEAIIVEDQTLTSIPYVNIGIKALAKGTVSDFEGQFILEDVSLEDVVTISSIGYLTKELTVEELLKIDSIKMELQEYDLGEIEIHASRFASKEFTLGPENKKRDMSIGYGSTQLGCEIGTLIEIKETTFIKKLHFMLNHAKGDSLLFRLHMYAYEDGKVGEDLLTQNILIQEKQRKGIIDIDLEEYNIVLDSDIMLALEWLRDYDEIGNKGITFNTRKGKKLKGLYIKQFSQGDFFLLPHEKKRKVCIYLTGKKEEK